MKPVIKKTISIIAIILTLAMAFCAPLLQATKVFPASEIIPIPHMNRLRRFGKIRNRKRF